MDVLSRGEYHLGVVSVNDHLVLPDGTYRNAFYGLLRLLPDAEIGKGFRSSERWSVAVYAEPDGNVVVLIPGCRVRGVVLCSRNRLHPDIYDATAHVSHE